MAHELTVAIWGPAKGSELELAAHASAAAIEARDCARRGLRADLPGADVLASTVVCETRVETGQAIPGFLVTLTVAASAPPSRPAGDLAWLCLRVESVVSVALLELLSPMVVDVVRVTGRR